MEILCCFFQKLLEKKRIKIIYFDRLAFKNELLYLQVHGWNLVKENGTSSLPYKITI